jgi:hypothetical protein
MMPESFSPAERELLAVVLDRLVPAGRGFPAAGALGIGSAPTWSAWPAPRRRRGDSSSKDFVRSPSRASGGEDSPPQPHGHPLDPFVNGLVDRVRRSPLTYRQP